MFPSIPCCPQCLSDIAGRQMGMLVPDKEAATFHSEISRAMLSLITLEPTETHLWEKREVPMTSLSNLLSPVRRHTCHSADGDIGPGTCPNPSRTLIERTESSDGQLMLTPQPTEHFLFHPSQHLFSLRPTSRRSTIAYRNAQASQNRPGLQQGKYLMSHILGTS